jgi:ribosomal protein S18 acetylase RimI-like enzyme
MVHTIGDVTDFLVWSLRADGNVEIVDIAVNSERRKGKGRLLVQELFHKLHCMTRVFAITRTTNEIAQQFYERLGFQVSGVLRRYYDDENGADAILFIRRAGGPV